jgi:hypothetical protein
MPQHSTFEEEFHDEPRSYQTGYADSQVAYPTDAPQKPMYSHLSGQKLQMHDLYSERAPSAGMRLALAIISIAFTFVTLAITLIITMASTSNPFPIIPLTLCFAFFFEIILLSINLIFSRHN